ncbi:MAG TPA: translation initiation factor IF-2 [Thermoanaerobaculia bacterium]|nr:translation initiation factor IF-2 [Thermoanaerobaculia bacterium]
MIGMAEQDLVFKLRSIGVRVEGDDAQVETDVLKQVLEGKRLATPREVIVRDEDAQRAAAAAPRPGTPAAPRRLPLEPPRPTRRAIIHKVEAPIPTLPHRERVDTGRPGEDMLPAGAEQGIEPPLVHEVEAAPAAPAIVEAAVVPPPSTRPTTPPRQPAPSSRPPATPAARPAGARPESGSGRPGATPPRPAPSARPLASPGRPATLRPSSTAPRPPAPTRPPATSTAAAAAVVTEARRKAKDEAEAKKQAAAKDRGKPKRHAATEAQVDDELRHLRGKVDIEQLEDGPVAARRRRRAQRTAAAEAAAASGERPTGATDGPVTIVEGMTVRDLAEKLDITAKDLIKKLFERGILASINHVLEPDLAEQLAQELGFETMQVSFEEEVQLRREESQVGEKREGKVTRPPVVTIMGHVDHGKTTLLDAIRESRLVDAEHGGITQHIGAYQVDKGGRKLVFLDTPGHEAFTQLRARGGQAADIVVLVVAADDGVMPQTLEAIDHARAAKVPIVVAVNKIDKANTNQDRVKKELSEHGLMPEDWGGETVTVPMSALKKQGINELLEMILLTTDILELKANPEMPAQGVVLEARKETGRGVVATVLVQDGVLHVGDVFVTGATFGRVRSMVDDVGNRVPEAGPSTPVEVTGFQEIPGAGDAFQVVQDEQKARGIAEFRQQEQRRRELAPMTSKISLEQLFDKIVQGEVKELPVVLKTDVQGSAEVLSDALGKLITPKVKVNVIHAGVGAISTNDVLLASASKAIVIGFNVRPERNASELAEKEGVEIRLHTVIYELLDELKNAMVGLLEPTFQEVTKGRAEVRDTFKIPKIGTIAGCHVVEGVIPRSAGVRLLRDNVVVYEGKIASLRRFKDDASEVRTGFDCGIGLERFQDVKPGDLIEAYAREEVRQTL